MMQTGALLKLTLHGTSCARQVIPITGPTLTDAGLTACLTNHSP